MSILLTGGAGFIGSSILRELNNSGVFDVIIVDNIDSTQKWKLLIDKQYIQYIHKDNLFACIENIENITGIIHMGACTNTKETNFDYLYTNNTQYSISLWNYCKDHKIPFIYASSAATYGDGELGFDDFGDIKRLIPINAYGYSKQLFDIWVQRQTITPPQFVGLKFFNVFGPNEYYKGDMASMFFQGYNQIVERGFIELFKSYKEQIADGDQERDFIYIKDVCKIVLFFLNNRSVSGLFNVGTGEAHSFNQLSKNIFHSLGKNPDIRYIDMPKNLLSKYQYYTKSSIHKLRQAGYVDNFMSLNDSTEDYVRNYLLKTTSHSREGKNVK